MKATFDFLSVGGKKEDWPLVERHYEELASLFVDEPLSVALILRNLVDHTDEQQDLIMAHFTGFTKGNELTTLHENDSDVNRLPNDWLDEAEEIEPPIPECVIDGEIMIFEKGVTGGYGGYFICAFYEYKGKVVMSYGWGDPLLSAYMVTVGEKLDWN